MNSESRHLPFTLPNGQIVYRTTQIDEWQRTYICPDKDCVIAVNMGSTCVANHPSGIVYTPHHHTHRLVFEVSEYSGNLEPETHIHFKGYVEQKTLHNIRLSARCRDAHECFGIFGEPTDTSQAFFEGTLTYNR